MGAGRDFRFDAGRCLFSGRYGERRPAVWEDVIEDREVVRREVPEHVYVALDQAKVDPDRVEKVKLAEHPGTYELADALDRGRVTVRAQGILGVKPEYGTPSAPLTIPREVI